MLNCGFTYWKGTLSASTATILLSFLRMSRRATGAQVRSKLMGASSASVQVFHQPASLPHTVGPVCIAELAASALTLPLAESVQPEVGNVYDLESWTVYYLTYKPGVTHLAFFSTVCTVLSFFCTLFDKDTQP